MGDVGDCRFAETACASETKLIESWAVGSCERESVVVVARVVRGRRSAVGKSLEPKLGTWAWRPS